MMKFQEILARIINLFAGIVVIFLLFRFAFRLFGANPATPFVSWLYSATTPLLAPFRGIFPSPVVEAGSVVEFPTLFAILAYTIAAWLVVELIYLVARGERTESVRVAHAHEHNGHVDIFEEIEEE